MNYELNAAPAIIKLVSPPEVRIAECEREIAAALERHGCILIVQVATKEPSA